MTFGTKDLAAADGELLRLGKVVCEGLGIEGLGFGQVVQRLVQVGGTPDDHRSQGAGQERDTQPVR